MDKARLLNEVCDSGGATLLHCIDRDKAFDPAVILVCLLTAVLAGLGILSWPAHARVTGSSGVQPVLVYVDLTLDPDLRLTALDDIPIVTLVDVDSGQDVVNLAWSKDRSSFFETWILRLSSTSFAAVPQSTTLTPNHISYRLVSATPRPGAQYRVALSFDPMAGIVSVAVTELADGRVLYRGHVVVEAVQAQLQVHAGEGASSSVSMPARSEVREVHSAFAPVGTDWCLVDLAAPSVCLTGLTRASETIGLRVRDGVGAPGTSLKLIAASGAQERELFEIPITQGMVIEPLPVEMLFPGRSSLALHYVQEANSWQLGVMYIDMAEATVSVALDQLVLNDSGVEGVVTIESSADVDGLELAVTADIYTAPFRRDWQQLASGVPLVSGPVSVRAGHTTHPFSAPLTLNEAPLVRIVPHTVVDSSRVRIVGKVSEYFVTSPEALLHVDDTEKERLQELEAAGLLQIRPIVLPGDPALGENIHFGHPVAAMSGDSIVVLYYVREHHYGGEVRTGPSIAPAQRSSTMMVRSPDGGSTWSDPVDMRIFGPPQIPSRVGFGNAVGTTHEGALLFVTANGVYESTDHGMTWTHYPEAFSDRQLAGPRTNNGPRLIGHPTYGQIVLGTMGFDTDEMLLFKDEIWIRYSIDGGRTWEEVVRTGLPPFAKPVEPTGIYLQGKTVVLARAHGGYHEGSNTWRYVQIVLDERLEVEDVQLTNIPATHRSGASGPWSQDTVDLALNPVTQRVEAVVTNRTGGEPGNLHDPTYQTLNLWSIDPTDLLAGSAEWRFEATLLRRRRDDVLGVDGMHPGAAIMDEANGVQRIYVYLGFGQGPSGIFEITRTLETDRLRAFRR